MKKGLLFFLLLLSISLLAVGCSQGEADESVSEVGGADKGKVVVDIQEVGRGSIYERLSLSGDVQAKSSLPVVAQTGGDILAVMVSVGSNVSAGDVVVQMKDNGFRNQVQQAETSLRMSELQLDAAREGDMVRAREEMENSIRQAKLNYEDAENSLLQVQLSYEDAKKDYENMSNLYEHGVIPRKEYEGVKLAYNMAEINLANVKNQIKMAKNNLESAQTHLKLSDDVLTPKQIEQLELQIEQSRMSLQTAIENYEDTYIKAPISGKISLVDAKVGQSINPRTPVVTIIDFSEAYVEVKVTERILSDVSEGNLVEVEIISSGARFDGKVKEISYSPLQGTRSYLMKIVFKPQDDIRVGQNARAEIITGQAENVVVVPRAALIEENGGYKLFVLEDDVAVERNVTLGLMDYDYAEVLGGLQESEVLVVSGHQYLNDGDLVRVSGGEEN